MADQNDEMEETCDFCSFEDGEHDEDCPNLDDEDELEDDEEE